MSEVTIAIDQLRELAQGLPPAQLDAGLDPALRELAGRAPAARRGAHNRGAVQHRARGGGVLHRVRGPDQRDQALGRGGGSD